MLTQRSSNMQVNAGPIRMHIQSVVWHASNMHFRPCRGAVQAAVIAFGLFVFTDKVSTLIEGASLPDQYTVSDM